MLTLIINGNAHTFSDPPSARELLAHLGLGEKRLALERNGSVVPRSQFDATFLADGDRIEVIVAVGGG